MAELNYESLVAQLIKPLVTHPDEVCTTSFVEGEKVLVKALAVSYTHLTLPTNREV